MEMLDDTEHRTPDETMQLGLASHGWNTKNLVPYGNLGLTIDLP